MRTRQVVKLLIKFDKLFANMTKQARAYNDLVTAAVHISSTSATRYLLIKINECISIQNHLHLDYTHGIPPYRPTYLRKQHPPPLLRCRCTVCAIQRIIQWILHWPLLLLFQWCGWQWLWSTQFRTIRAKEKSRNCIWTAVDELFTPKSQVSILL